MNTTMQVRPKGGDVFEIDIRGHLVHVDQPLDAGGSDVAPTPTELFVASLAACVAHYARGYLVRHGLPTDDLCVAATYAMEERPARIGRVEISVHPGEGVPEERRTALLAVARHCTVHNTLAQPPTVDVELAA